MKTAMRSKMLWALLCLAFTEPCVAGCVDKEYQCTKAGGNWVGGNYVYYHLPCQAEGRR
jgi:hypothetical protein